MEKWEKEREEAEVRPWIFARPLQRRLRRSLATAATLY